MRTRPPRARRRPGTRPRATAAPSSNGSTARPSSSSRSRSGSVSRLPGFSHTCTAVPKRLVFSTVGRSSSARIAAIGEPVRTSTIGRSAKTCLSSRDRAERREPARVHERQPVAVLGLVEVVRRDEHRHALPARGGRSAARTAGATPGRRRRSARRGTGSAARAGWRSRAPAAAASRRPGRASSVCSRPLQAGHLEHERRGARQSGSSSRP